MGAGPEGGADFATDGLGGGRFDLSVVTTTAQAVDLHDQWRRCLCTLVLTFESLPRGQLTASRLCRPWLRACLLRFLAVVESTGGGRVQGAGRSVQSAQPHIDR